MMGRSERGYTSGQYMAFFMLLFMPMGIALWLLLDNPGFIGVGVVLGISLGTSFDRQRREGRAGGPGSLNVGVLGIAFALVFLGIIFILLVMI